MIELTTATAGQMVRIALGHVTREYPHKLDHVLLSDADAQPPRALHPIFFGSFDWHSCVHGWWTLLTLRRLHPALPEAGSIAELADASFSAAKVAGELAYLERPLSGGFERPYGWAWLLALHGEAARHSDRAWAAALEPLARAFAERLRGYLAVLTYPIRTGTHFNTAFALVLAHEWAVEFDPSLAQAIAERTWAWFGGDRDCQAWEPSGDDFLSPAWIEALAMARCCPDRFDWWFAAFLPRAGERAPETLFTPATVSDRSDGKIAHLDGLNLSRAWCQRRLAGTVGPALAATLRSAAVEHLAAAWPHLQGDYAGEHWLATFALLALLAAG
ncbi:MULTISPECIES: DUF2891 domain-containing protein [Sphingomonas]|uniref:DUF2891 domain-containing protein n=1 Tax=Sphingomonas TaxID=13687 RepID=UPI000DEFC6A5|nr:MULTISPECIES: DUF2891 domain-containing protein [Sphingomonas]